MKSWTNSIDVLTWYFKDWAVVFPNHLTGSASLKVYLEALSDLTPSQIERGCWEAQKTMEEFPKPGHIRKGLARAARLERDFERLGPPLIRWNESDSMTAQERKTAADQCAELRRRLPVRQVTPRKKFVAWPVKPREQQVAEMKAKGYL
jgi:hypothetical protein